MKQYLEDTVSRFRDPAWGGDTICEVTTLQVCPHCDAINDTDQGLWEEDDNGTKWCTICKGQVEEDETLITWAPGDAESEEEDEASSGDGHAP